MACYGIYILVLTWTNEFHEIILYNALFIAIVVRNTEILRKTFTYKCNGAQN